MPRDESTATQARLRVLTLSEQAIKSLAPDELPYFAECGESFLRNPKRALRLVHPDRAAGGEDVGFGAELVEVVTPLVLVAVAEVVLPPVQGLLRSWGSRVAARLRRLRGRSEAEPAEPASQAGSPEELTHEDLVRVREAALVVARRFRPEEEALLFADALYGSLCAPQVPPAQPPA
jgi:hypothetical protein